MKCDTWAALKSFWGFPNWPAILGALHRYEVSIYSQGHNWVVLTVFLLSKRCVFYKLESQRKSWSSVADDPSVPLLPRTRAASKTNQGKRISSHLHLHLEARFRR